MQILNRPYEQYAVDPNAVVSEMDVLDVKTVVSGLIKIFKEKLYQLPSSHATKAYRLLVNHLELHYQKPVVFDNASSIRYIVSTRSFGTFVLLCFCSLFACFISVQWNFKINRAFCVFNFTNDFSSSYKDVVQRVCNLISRGFDFLTKLFFIFHISHSMHYNNITPTDKVKKFLAGN